MNRQKNPPSLPVIDWNHHQSQLRSAWHANPDAVHAWLHQMGFTQEVCEGFGLGFKKDTRDITWPERNELGEIVGIGRRNISTGTKSMIHGSKRGLIYAPEPEFGGLPTYINHPVVIVEGLTDALACTSRGFYAIGLPSAKGTSDSNGYLAKMVKDRDIAIACENDRGVGAFAFIDRGRSLLQIAKSIRSLYPSLHVKDLREWLDTEGKDAIAEIEDQLKHRLPWSEDPDQIMTDENLLSSTSPVDIAEAFISKMQGKHDASTVRHWAGAIVVFQSPSFVTMDHAYLKTQVYKFLKNKVTRQPIKKRTES